MKKFREARTSVLVRFGFCIYLFLLGFLVGGGMSKTIKVMQLQ